MTEENRSGVRESRAFPNSASKSAFILGCGYTGTALADALLARGWQVGAASREGTPRGPGISTQRRDLLQPEPLELEVARGAVVYYMVPPLFRSYEPESRPHLQVFERVLDQLEAHRIDRLIYLSSTSVYGDCRGEWVDEESPPRPDSPWGMMREELEQRVWRFGAEAHVPALVLRLPEIYGPGRGPLERLRRGYAPSYPERWTNRIHVEDLVYVLSEMGERGGPDLLLCGDDEPARAGDVYSFAAELLGLRGLPPPAAEPRDANLKALSRDSKRCRNVRLRTWLGRPLRYPTFREGLRALLGGA